MLTERERKFVEYWQHNRLKEKKLFRQLLIGLPVGLLFAVPIILNFSAGWYKRADMWARGHSDEHLPGVLAVAALMILAFVAVFSKRHNWERNEQIYRELLAREASENKEAGAAGVQQETSQTGNTLI